MIYICNECICSLVPNVCIEPPLRKAVCGINSYADIFDVWTSHAFILNLILSTTVSTRSNPGTGNLFFPNSAPYYLLISIY